MLSYVRPLSLVLLLAAVVLGGSGCPGGNGSAPQTGVLEVQVLGLPSNADASVTVSAGGVIYSDFCTGFLRSFRLAIGQATERVDWNVPSVGNVLSFGEDANRELYVITGSNRVYRIAQQ